MELEKEIMENQVTALAGKFKGKVLISMEKEDWRQGQQDLSLAIVIKLTNDRPVNKLGLSTALRKAWNVQDRATFWEVAENLFVVRFKKREDRDRTLLGGPWTYRGAVVLMKRWDSEIPPKKAVLDTFSIWLQIHNVPLEMMTDKLAHKVAAVAGRVIKVSDFDGEVVSKKYMRVRIEMKVNEPLESGCYLETPNGEPLWLDFKYEYLPKYCYRCGLLSHFTNNCSRPGNEGRMSGDFGPHLRAQVGFVKGVGEDLQEATQAEDDRWLSMAVQRRRMASCFRPALEGSAESEGLDLSAEERGRHVDEAELETERTESRAAMSRVAAGSDDSFAKNNNGVLSDVRKSCVDIGDKFEMGAGGNSDLNKDEYWVRRHDFPMGSVLGKRPRPKLNTVRRGKAQGKGKGVVVAADDVNGEDRREAKKSRAGSWAEREVDGSEFEGTYGRMLQITVLSLWI
ncbi:hypothetical protein QQ045_016731 [Rhodiola kirilowii]